MMCHPYTWFMFLLFGGRFDYSAWAIDCVLMNLQCNLFSVYTVKSMPSGSTNFAVVVAKSVHYELIFFVHPDWNASILQTIYSPGHCTWHYWVWWIGTLVSISAFHFTYRITNIAGCFVDICMLIFILPCLWCFLWRFHIGFLRNMLVFSSETIGEGIE